MKFNYLIERVFASRWIAGPLYSDAIVVSFKLKKRHILSMINFLGENYSNKNDIKNNVNEYLKLIKKINANNINSSISIKPTQIGLLYNKSELRKNYFKIVETAKKYGVMVWLDMEEHQYVTQTIDLYMLKISSKNTGICIQSYLKRSMYDVKKIVKNNGYIRLVKGAYKESKNIAFESREKVTENYANIMLYLFLNSKHFVLATHDLNMIKLSESLNKKYKRDVSYAMLNGIRNREAVKLANSGHKMIIYVPYGTEWFKYSYRRLREASNLKLVLRSLLSRQNID